MKVVEGGAAGVGGDGGGSASGSASASGSGSGRVCQLSMRLRSGPGTVDYCMSEQGCAAGAAPSPARVPEDPRFRWHTFPARPEPEFSDSASSHHDWQLPTARFPLPAAC